MASQSELAVVYAALALADDDKPISVEAIQAIATAAGITIEPFWIGLYVNALKDVNIKELVQNIGSGVGSSASAPEAVSAAPTAGGGGTPAPAKEDKKKEETKEESDDDDMGFGLFD